MAMLLLFDRKVNENTPRTSDVFRRPDGYDFLTGYFQRATESHICLRHAYL